MSKDVIGGINPLRPIRIAERIREMTDDAGMATNTLISKLNAVNFERAIQEGYRMACADHGKPAPLFEDPLKKLMKDI